MLAARAALQTWLARLPPDQHPMVERLRGPIASVTPRSHEIVYHDALGYGPSDAGFDRILSIAAFERHANLGFLYSAALSDPDGLLKGGGKRMRHVPLRRPAGGEHPAIARLVCSLVWCERRGRKG